MRCQRVDSNTQHQILFHKVNMHCNKESFCTTFHTNLFSLKLYYFTDECIWKQNFTDKKEKRISSYIRQSRREQLQSHICLTASSFMTKYLRISLYIRKPFLIYDFATTPIGIFSVGTKYFNLLPA